MCPKATNESIDSALREPVVGNLALPAKVTWNILPHTLNRGVHSNTHTDIPSSLLSTHIPVPGMHYVQ